MGVAAIMMVVFSRPFGSLQQSSSESAHLFDTFLSISVSKTKLFSAILLIPACPLPNGIVPYLISSSHSKAGKVFILLTEAPLPVWD